jgi:hypothetical protein
MRRDGLRYGRHLGMWLLFPVLKRAQLNLRDLFSRSPRWGWTGIMGFILDTARLITIALDSLSFGSK